MANGNKQGPIDFVVTWVDGDDSEWLKEKERWKARESNTPWSEWTTGDKRFRDWGLLKYWFRAVCEYAPWVNRVYFVTAGSVPKWLDVDCPKLTVVRHEEFIPDKYLPTFNSHCIEWNMHRIEGLSEQFVYFNDDFFLNAPVDPVFFFKDGLPRDFAALAINRLDRKRTRYGAYSAMILNDHWDMRSVIKNNLPKWFALCYGPKIWAKNLVLLSQKQFSGIANDHLPFAFLKSTFEELWELEGDELNRNCSDRFRGFYGISPNLISEWQRVEGKFCPRSTSCGIAFEDPSFFEKDENLRVLTRALENPRYKVVCINDEIEETDRYVRWGEELRNAFEQKLPQKGVFEK